MNFDVSLLTSINFNSVSWALSIPCALMALDILTGVVHAWQIGHLKSYRMREGLGRKFGEVSILVIGILFTAGIDLPIYVLGGLSAYIIFMELVSIMENLKKLGIPVPKFVDRAFGEIENKIQNGSKEDGNGNRTETDSDGEASG